jgi:hypothetical protein
LAAMKIISGRSLKTTIWFKETIILVPK